MKVELDLEVTYTVGGLPLFEWLADHIREEDAMDWKYDITCFNEVED